MERCTGARYNPADNPQPSTLNSQPVRRCVPFIVAALLAIHAALLAWGAYRHSPTLNEPGHLVAGISHWQFGRFELYRVNPPLVRMVAALPVLAAGYETDWSSFYEAPGARPVFAIGSDFIAANGERSLWLFTIARWACIPFSLIGGLVCFLWARELYGTPRPGRSERPGRFDTASQPSTPDREPSTLNSQPSTSTTDNGPRTTDNLPGLLALTLWCFEPNIIAHGQLITPDVAATSFGLLAGYLFWRWLKRPTWGRAAAAGFALGVAQLAKMSWLFLFALWPILWLIWRITQRRLRYAQPSTPNPQPLHQSAIPNPQSAIPTPTDHGPRTTDHPPFLQLTTIMLLGLYVLNLGYGFDGTFTPLKDFTFVSRTLTGEERSGTPGNRFADTWLGHVPMPLPKQYLLGLDVQKRDFEAPQRSYLRGEWKDAGWWYYYLYGLAVKLPHGTQLLILLALAMTIAGWFRRPPDPQPSTLNPQLSSGPQPSTFNSQLSRDSQPSWLNDLTLLAPALILFVLVSSQTAFNHHVRYVLPVLGPAFVLVGRLAQAMSGNLRDLRKIF